MEEVRIKPGEKQLSYQQWEMGIFLHFGIRTFYEGHKDWDFKHMPLEAFNPVNLDCEQWISTAKKAGFNYAVLVCKHHDGFANWPSKYTDYSVANTPWKDGKGDVVREFTEACHKHNMKVGLYYSPADASSMSLKKSSKEYDEYFISQISELLTDYGEIDILWFDACGSEDHQYDWKRIIKEIRAMQPGIRIFNIGEPDFRWVGNEAGIAPSPCFNVVDSTPFSMLKQSQEALEGNKYAWLPAECDCRMREINWFYSEKDEHTVKSLDELIGMYYYSVGRGTNLLINIGPNREGLLPEKDSKRLIEFGEEIKRRFSNPLAVIENFHVKNGQLVHKFKEPILINHLILQEDIRYGESIEAFKIKIRPYPYGEPITVYEGKTVGHKAICRFNTIRTDEVYLEIDKSQDEVLLSKVSIHYVL